MDKVRSSRRKEGGDKADTGKLHCIGFLFITACVKNYHCGIAELDHHEVMIFQVGLKRINNEKKIMKHTKRGGQQYGNVLWGI